MEDESNVYNDYTPDPKQILKNIRNSNVNKLTFGHLNINSLRNKFDQLTEMLKGFVDIFLISESKLDDSFPEGQFIIDGYRAPFRFDRHGNGGVNSLNDVLNEHESQEHLLNDPDCFYKVCAEVLNRHAPQKKKYVRGNNKPFMKKTFSQTILQRTKLRNKFLKDPIEHNKISYTKQRNWCVSLLRKEKKKYFANLNEKDIIDNKKVLANC